MLSLACLLPLAGQEAKAPDQPTVIQDLEGTQNINQSLRVLPDPHGVLDPAQVLSGTLDAQFQPITKLDPGVKIH